MPQYASGLLPEQNIMSKNKIGGKLGDTELIYEIVVDEETSHPQKLEGIEDANIVILTFAFEPLKPIESVKKIQILRSEQKYFDEMVQKYFDEMVQKLKDVSATLIICQWGFDDEANHLLMQRNFPAVRWAGGVELELISMTTGRNEYLSPCIGGELIETLLATNRWVLPVTV